MNRKRLAVITVLTLATIVTASRGSAYVHQTIAMYSGACSPLSGFPGLLQTLNLVPAGDCPVLADGVSCADNNHVCDLLKPPSGPGGKGHCRQIKNDKRNTACMCQ